MSQPRTPEHPIHPQFAERWSPRAFGPETISEAELMTILEAGRWAPSAYNAQPWRFAYALRGDAAWDQMLGLLVPGNQAWAKQAAALVFIASKRTMRPRGADADVPSHSHSFDAGAAWGYIALQAHISGFNVHGMSGVDFPRATAELGLGDDYRLEMAFAVGKRGDASTLPPHFQAIEAPNDRQPLEDLVVHGSFKHG